MTEPQIPDDLIGWLEKRRNNARRIAATKVTRADVAGWLEDAEYFNAAIERIAKAEAERDTLKARNEEIYKDNLAVSKWKGERIRELEKQVARLTEQP